jgi:hypothetical protein
MLRIIAGALIALGPTASFSSGQSTAVLREVQAVEEARRQAVLHGDRKAMDVLMAEDYMVITTVGVVDDKTGELALYENGQRRAESWESRDTRIRVYGQTAVVTGLALVADTLRGQARRIRFRYTHVWVKRDGRWRVVSRQATTVAE